MKFDPFNDNNLDYYSVVVEQTNPHTNKVEILDYKEGPNGLNFLRFRACLQTFGHRNRNRRLWLAHQMKAMLNEPHVNELLVNGFPGENGHPIPPTGKVTMERIMTIDPNNMSHLMKSFEWVGDSHLYSVIETLDEGPGSPGYRFMRNIMQKMNPSFSLRSVVPQRTNADGSIDVTGPGRFITYDRVILPSHVEAYIDKNIPVKNIVTRNEFEMAMENFTSFVIEHSTKVNKIIDKVDPVLESATMNDKGILTINSKKGGIMSIAPEAKYRREINNIIRNI